MTLWAFGFEAIGVIEGSNFKLLCCVWIAAWHFYVIAHWKLGAFCHQILPDILRKSSAGRHFTLNIRFYFTKMSRKIHKICHLLQSWSRLEFQANCWIIHPHSTSILCPEKVVCFLHLLHIFVHFRLDFIMEANTMDPDQTAPDLFVWFDSLRPINNSFS